MSQLASSLSKLAVSSSTSASAASAAASANASANTSTNATPKYFDIGVNFTDPMFQGHYNGKPQHPSDIEDVISRAKLFNVDKMLVTGSSLEESLRSLEICRSHSNLYSTVGVHPCTVTEFENEGTDPQQHLQQLKELAIQGAQQGIVKAFGEIGLDYDRLHYASAELQKRYFLKQLEVACEVKLPLFLHMRAACDDFVSIIKPFLPIGQLKENNKSQQKKPQEDQQQDESSEETTSTPSTANGKKLAKNGVVHSFTGTLEELQKLLDLGFYIGINGCSLKTEENLKVAAKIPLDRLLIETDAPWCEIRKSHAAYRYLTAYPNVFYPKVVTGSSSAEQGAGQSAEQNNNSSSTTANSNSNSSTDISTNEQGEKSQKQKQKKSKQQPQQQKGKQQQSSLHELLPFPSFKKEHYVKKYNPEAVTANSAEINKIGEKAAPVIKSRNEPVYVGFVAEVMSKLMNVEPEILIRETYKNGLELFEIDQS